MHKKIEEAAKEYSNNNSEGIGLGHDDDAFKAGAEFALREAIEIVEPKYHGHRKLFGNSSSTMTLRMCLNELEQLLLNKGENNGKL